jgi:glutathione S-transferase
MRLFDFAPSGNCYKVRLLLAHLGLACERVPVDVVGGEGRGDAFRAARNPHGRVPVLELDDGRVLAESGAILWYLAEGTPYLPDGRLGRARTLQWMFFEQNAIEPSIAVVRYWETIARRPDAVGDLESRRRAGREALDALSRHLAGDGPFLTGNRPTIADLAVYGYTHVADEAGIPLAGYPEVVRWIDRVRSLPAHVPMLENEEGDR